MNRQCFEQVIKMATITRLLKLVWVQFTERKLRSFLTILGIVVGVVALVSLIILSQALKAGVNAQFDRFGSDTILVAPKSAVGTGLPQGSGVMTDRDIKAIESIPQIIQVQPMLIKNLKIQYGKDTIIMPVRSMPINNYFQSFIKMEAAQGRLLSPSDYKSVNIGYSIANKAFSKDVYVGSTLVISGDKYKVVGIFEEQGDANSDSAIVVPIDALRNTIGDSGALTGVQAKVSPGANLDAIEQKIKDAEKRIRGQDDIAVTTPKKIKEQIGGFLGVLNIVIISIALISLLVAALGIMNSLFTSVLQRTKEIGTMKAIGATTYQILFIFITESAILGFFGGIIGLMIGVGIAYAAFTVINTLGFVKLVFSVPLSLIVLSVVFSTLVGIISGLIPALRASRLEPVDALRYE